MNLENVPERNPNGEAMKENQDGSRTYTETEITTVLMQGVQNIETLRYVHLMLFDDTKGVWSKRAEDLVRHLPVLAGGARDLACSVTAAMMMGRAFSCCVLKHLRKVSQAFGRHENVGATFYYGTLIGVFNGVLKAGYGKTLCEFNNEVLNLLGSLLLFRQKVRFPEGDTTTFLYGFPTGIDVEFSGVAAGLWREQACFVREFRFLIFGFLSSAGLTIERQRVLNELPCVTQQIVGVFHRLQSDSLTDAEKLCRDLDLE